MTVPKRLRGRPITSASPPDVRLIRARGILDSWAWAVDSVGAMLSGVLATTRDRRMSAPHPLGRLGEIQEIVDAVLYLESATFLTGETLHVDGGAHASHW